MNKNPLRGCSHVYKYTLSQQLKKGKYIAITTVVAVLIIAALIGVIIFTSAISDNASLDNYNVSKVYVIDNTGDLGVPDYDAYAKAFNVEGYKETQFVKSSSDLDSLLENEDTEYIIVQTKSDNTYSVEIITGKNVEDDAQRNVNVKVLKSLVPSAVKQQLYASSGLTAEQIIQSLVPVTDKTSKLGVSETEETKSSATSAISFVFVLLIYAMVILYGSQICSEVPVEKTSKLVEQLLINVSPYSLLTGKVLAIITSSFIQFIIWILSALIGVFGGNFLTKILFSVNKTSVDSMLDLINTVFGSTALNVGNIILAVLLVMLGIVFYLMLAAFGGAMLSKPEEANNVQMLFLMPLIVSYMLVIFATANGNIALVYCFVPFTGAMIAPAAVITGAMSPLMGIVAILINIACDMLILWLAAKVYRGMLFFKGNKITPKLIINSIKRG